MPDPQRRLTVAPDTSTGRPASKTAIRPTLRLSSPAWLAAPHCTSSMADGSSDGLRSRRRRTTWAARSSGRTKASCPPIRPIGVRQPSTMKTSVMPRWRVTDCCPPTPASASLRRRFLPPCYAWGTCPGPLPPPPLRSGGGTFPHAWGTCPGPLSAGGLILVGGYGSGHARTALLHRVRGRQPPARLRRAGADDRDAARPAVPHGASVLRAIPAGGASRGGSRRRPARIDGSRRVGDDLQGPACHPPVSRVDGPTHPGDVPGHSRRVRQPGRERLGDRRRRRRVAEAPQGPSRLG